MWESVTLSESLDLQQRSGAKYPGAKYPAVGEGLL